MLHTLDQMMGQLARVFGNCFLGCVGQMAPWVPFMQERRGHRRVIDWYCKAPSFSEEGLLVIKEKRQGDTDSYGVTPSEGILMCGLTIIWPQCSITVGAKNC